MEGERREVNNLDLNEEPTEQTVTDEDIDSMYTRIEERIRRLEDLTLRARQPQEWRLSRQATIEESLNVAPPPEVEDTDTDTDTAVRLERVEAITTLRQDQLSTRERLEAALRQQMAEAAERHESLEAAARQERLDCFKRSDSSLLALALESNGETQDGVSQPKNSGESFFDCNICFGKARQPILTCCGHLYCWPCFYQLTDVGPDTKECPQCKGEVKDTGVIPIYGSSNEAVESEVEKSDLKIPPRPQSRRIESLRQQRITRGGSHSFRIEEVLRGLHSFSTISSNLSSALNSAERIVEDLEGIAQRFPPSRRGFRVVIDADTNSDVVVEGPDPQAVAITMPGLASSSRTTVENGTTSTDVPAMQPGTTYFIPSRSTSTSRRIIQSGTRLTELSVGLPRRARTRSQINTLLQERISRERLLSRALQSEEPTPEAPLPTSNSDSHSVGVTADPSSSVHIDSEELYTISEANASAPSSSSRRRSDAVDSPGEANTDFRESKRRRLR